MKFVSISVILRKNMQVLLILLVSCLSGIFAGMGMGGGTFLIPLLSLCFSVEQIICQSTNVVCFIVLAIICSAIYIKNKLIDFKVFLCVSFPSAIIAFFASLFAIRIKSYLLGMLFAIFIIFIGVFYFIRCMVCFAKNKKK